MVTQQQGESWHVLYEGAFPRRALLEREMRHRVTLAPAHRTPALEDRGIAVDGGVFSIVRSNG